MNLKYNKNKFSKINKSEYIQNIFVFLILYTSSSMFMQESISGTGRFISTFLVIIVYLVVKKFKVRINRGGFIIFLVLGSIQTLSMLFFGVNIEFGIGNLICLMNAFLISIVLSFEEFRKSFKNVIYFISIFSLIIFFINLTIPQILNIFPSYIWHKNIEFKNLFFCIVPVSTQYIRNFGVFPEPGMFQIYVNYALILELFLSNKLNIKHIIVLVITIITTQSTNGIIVLAILIIAFLLKKNHSSKEEIKRYRKIIGIFMIVIMVCIILLVKIPYFKYTFEKMFQMTSKNTNTLGSGAERLRSMLYSLEIYLNNMFLGVGEMKFTLENSNIIKTFTPLNWFAIYGTVYGVLCNYFYIIQVKLIRDNIIVKILIIIALFLLICSQSMNSSIFCMLIIFYGSSLINLGLNNTINN